MAHAATRSNHSGPGDRGAVLRGRGGRLVAPGGLTSSPPRLLDAAVPKVTEALKQTVAVSITRMDHAPVRQLKMGVQDRTGRLEYGVGV
jgi:hypothetical protein